MTVWKPGAELKTLNQRADCIRLIRRFFESRRVLEVETPLVVQYPAIETHLDSFSVITGQASETRFLITSPEYHMKRLLAAGSDSIFQLTRAFRCDEAGDRHNPEFTILEWYRKGWTHWQLMKEIDELLQTLLETKPAVYLSYKDAFKKELDIDPLGLTLEQFNEICRRKALSPPRDLWLAEANRDDRLDFLMSSVIEPTLGREQPVFIHDYPATQANLATLYEDQPQLAMRFEVYFHGIELGNGFCELTDATLQEMRFRQINRDRERIGKSDLELDDRFIAALKHGMPECAGVAMGVDRLVMLKLGIDEIDKVVAFSWKRA